MNLNCQILSLSINLVKYVSFVLMMISEISFQSMADRDLSQVAGKDLSSVAGKDISHVAGKDLSYVCF